MNLYKGYVPTKDKKSTMPFKGKTSKDLMTLEQVKDLSEYAGVLNDNTILIDVDDGEQAELLMQIVEEQQLDCKVICTSRGKHFLFKNDGVQQCFTHVKVAIGLTVDVKVGSKTSYEVLKVNNEERFVEWDIEEGLEYQTLPKWLTPCYSAFYLVLNHATFKQIKKRQSINDSDGFYIGLLYAVPLLCYHNDCHIKK